jgi:hypothetical protein
VALNGWDVQVYSRRMRLAFHTRSKATSASDLKALTGSPPKNRDGGKAPMNKNSMYLLDQRDSLVNNGKKKWNSQG